jgi:protein arginine kinase activator
LNCDACHSEQASIFLSQQVEGMILTVDLCPGCAQKLGVSAHEKIDLMALRERLSPPEAGEASVKICRFCGYTTTEWKKTGRLGCPHCYAVFSDALDSQIGSPPQDGYPGKAPKNAPRKT